MQLARTAGGVVLASVTYSVLARVAVGSARKLGMLSAGSSAIAAVIAFSESGLKGRADLDRSVRIIES